MINVTKTYLPKKEKYINYIDQIYNNGWVTNNGPLVNLLEKRLAEYLGVKNLVLVSNGTVALEVAYRALELNGLAITTPFSFVATTSSLVTNNLHPIFADIDPESFNLNPNNIEPLITKNTSAIVGVHVYGNPCDVDEIGRIAKSHNLKVIYDAAHAFGVKYKNTSVLNYGDISTLSFHATKIFHTIEGGALVINDDSLVQKVRYLINFGIKNTEEIPHLGINAKMNEFEAAMGLCVLDEMENIKISRQKIVKHYDQNLSNLVSLQKISSHSELNYAYYPVLFESEKILLKVQKNLNENNIYPRRYFYPSLDSLDYIEPKQVCAISRDISKRILCLPLYDSLELKDQNQIISIIKNTIL